MKRGKKIWSFLLTLCMLCTFIPVTAFAENQTEQQQAQAGMPFADVKQGEWYYDAISYVYEHNLMLGTSDTLFTPQGTLNRAMVAQILYSMEGRPAVSGSPAFRDVSSGKWYYNAIQWASQNGIAAGTGNGLFNPTGKVTREQFAQFLYSYAGKPAVEGTLDFPDAGNVSGWAINAVTWATQNKLINGNKKPDGQLMLEPTGKTTRAQAAVILRFFCENITIQLEPYSITDLTVSGTAVTAEVTAPRSCTLQVKFLNEETEADLNISATAAVSAGLELEEVKATATKPLPSHFIAEVSLVDGNGKQLCSTFTCIKYTTNYEKFEAQTVDDFEGKTVINFDDDKTDNFGVLSDTVKEPTAASGKNIITENADDTYTVTNIDATVKSLKPGDEVLFFDANGMEVLVSIGTIKISGTTATITRNPDAALEDYYQVLKVDMSVAADPEDIDMRQADAGVTLLNENAKQSSSDSTARSDEKGIDIIDENIDSCQSLEFGLNYETDHFTTGGTLELKDMISIEISYDAALFGKDFISCKILSETKGSFSLEIKAKVDNGEAVKNQTEEEEFYLGDIPFPIGYGFSCSVALTVPVELRLEGGATMEASYSMKSGFSYSSKSGTQEICKKNFDVSFIQAEAKFEVKAGPKLAVSIEFLEDVLKGEISGQIGGDFTAEVQTGSLGVTDEDSIHMCSLCADGDASLFAKAKIELSYKITKKLKGTPFSSTILNIHQHLFAFYASMINDTDSPLGGKITFGKGSCPNQKYRTTFHVKDIHGIEISGTPVSVQSDQTDMGTTESGKALYLYNGSYTAKCTLNGKALGRDFTIQDGASSVTLSETDDVIPSTDPDDPSDPSDPDSPDPADIVESGTCGDHLTWTLDTNGTLTISGTGEMYQYGWEYEKVTPWRHLNSQIKAVDIKNGVTNIGSYAFYNCENLSDVTISDSVTSIDSRVFMYCDSLTSILIPDSVTNLGSGVFERCALTGINIPDSVTSVGTGLFYACENLKTVSLGNNMPCISYAMFRSCSNLVSLRIPESVTSIDDYAFYFCYSLTGIMIPDRVTSIGRGAFGYCFGLTSITLPASVTSLGPNFFECSSNLKEIQVDSRNTAFCSVDGVVFNKNKTMLVQFPLGSSGTYATPDSVTSIGAYAFSYCNKLTDITIPDSVTSIGPYAFEQCDGVTDLVIPDRVTSIDTHAFTDCSHLSSVTLGNGITSISDYAFSSCTSLTSVTIPDSVTSIGRGSFQYCSNLTSVTIPDAVTSIEANAFQQCSSLTGITIPDRVISIGESAFSSCESLTSIVIPDGVGSISPYTFYGCDILAQITIGRGVTSIGSSAFQFCPCLTDVYYRGSEADWSAVSISSSNDPLTSATIHYNS